MAGRSSSTVWPSSDGDHVYRESNIYAVDVASGVIKRRITRDAGYWAAPVVSPDGKRIGHFGRPYTIPVVWQTSDL